MLVVMQAASSRAELEAVCQRAKTPGSRPPSSRVSLASSRWPARAAEVAERLAGLPGVARIAHPRPPAPPVTSNLRIAGLRPLVPPAILVEQLPLPPRARLRCIAPARR